MTLLSTDVWRLTCEGCGRMSGWAYDEDRNMWVCGKCRKPAYRAVVQECENCERYYIPEKLPDNMQLCRECDQ